MTSVLTQAGSLLRSASGRFASRSTQAIGMNFSNQAHSVDRSCTTTTVKVACPDIMKMVVTYRGTFETKELNLRSIQQGVFNTVWDAFPNVYPHGDPEQNILLKHNWSAIITTNEQLRAISPDEHGIITLQASFVKL